VYIKEEVKQLFLLTKGGDGRYVIEWQYLRREKNIAPLALKKKKESSPWY
jgi:hypothetical protein